MSDADTTPPTGRATRIVLVEDHRMVADAFTSAFALEPDFEVVGHVTTVAEAGDLVSRTEPDVALVDYRLPDGDGADVVTIVRRRRPEIRTLIVTSASDDRSLTRALDADADGYLLKDQPVEELIAGVRAVAEGGSAYAPSLLVRLLARSGHASRAGRNPQLSDREAEVLHLLALGRSTSAMAAELHLSTNTVRNHVQGVLSKLDAHSRLEAVAEGIRSGLIPSPDAAPPNRR